MTMPNKPLSEAQRKDFVKEHISRCIEVYSEHDDKSDTVPRDVFEMMRSDLMIAVGMLMVLSRLQESGT